MKGILDHKNAIRPAKKTDDLPFQLLAATRVPDISNNKDLPVETSTSLQIKVTS